MAVWAFLGLALVAGMALPVQVGVNAQLASWVGGPIRATAVSFVVGTVALLAVAALFTRGQLVERARPRGGSGSAASSAPSTSRAR